MASEAIYTCIFCRNYITYSECPNYNNHRRRAPTILWFLRYANRTEAYRETYRDTVIAMLCTSAGGKVGTDKLSVGGQL